MCFQSCLGVRGVRAAFMEACRHCKLYVVLYAAECGPLAGWLVGLFLATSSAPAADQRRTLVYKFLHYDACIYLSQHTHGVLLHAWRLLYSDAHKLRAAVHTNGWNSQTHHKNASSYEILNELKHHGLVYYSLYYISTIMGFCC